MQGPLIVTEELHSLSFESELHLSQSGLSVKLEVRNVRTSNLHNQLQLLGQEHRDG